MIVKNGTSTEGLASRTANYLRGEGIDVVGESNADQVTSACTIIDYTGKPYTIQYLANLCKTENSRVLNRYDPTSQVDVEFVVGTLFAESNSLP